MTNQEVIHKVGVSRGLMTIIRRRKKGFPGLRKKLLDTGYLLGMKEGTKALRRH